MTVLSQMKITIDADRIENNVDPDQTAPLELSDLDSHCLLIKTCFARKFTDLGMLVVYCVKRPFVTCCTSLLDKS